jgi:hypothetical protein
LAYAYNFDFSGRPYLGKRIPKRLTNRKIDVQSLADAVGNFLTNRAIAMPCDGFLAGTAGWNFKMN